ncbi:hypothetical protein [Sphingomonas sp. ERG5]|uniref:hypothetical protein n=1 Tax=Sphingomonas sp. ERG5 TaxID=1381597 RepID=UPI000B224F73|nr:hypothetical protein [Sphingomonas sp. ERG5]
MTSIPAGQSELDIVSSVAAAREGLGGHPGRASDSKFQAASAGALLIVCLLLRAGDFGNPVIHVDEQYYLLVGDRMLRGALPYIDIWDRKPIGLFTIFAGIRLLPGNGIVAYQLAATLFAAATSWLVQRAALRIGAGRAGALAAAVIYLVWLPLFSGGAGQSPVFYNLFMTGAALLTLRLPQFARDRAVSAIVVNGMLACLLAGVAIQVKYTPAVEGAFFGIVHIHYLCRAGARPVKVVASALVWLLLGLVPTLAAIAIYAEKGAGPLQAFWFANFGSILLRAGYSYPAEIITGRLAGTIAKLLPLAICGMLALRHRPLSDAMKICLGWAIAAVAGYGVLGTYFDHYALPLIAPLAILAACTPVSQQRYLIAALGAGLALLAIETALEPAGDAAGAYAVAATVHANSGRGCPYVFIGDAITYQLADSCLPTPYAFPSMLGYAPEQGALGIDPAVEVRRVLAVRPPVIVTATQPLAAWNTIDRALVAGALTREYRLVFTAPRGDYRTLVYLRRDLPFHRVRKVH